MVDVQPQTGWISIIHHTRSLGLASLVPFSADSPVSSNRKVFPDLQLPYYIAMPGHKQMTRNDPKP